MVLLQVWCCYAEPNMKHPIFREFKLCNWKFKILNLYLQYEIKLFQTIRNSLGIVSINFQALQVWCCYAKPVLKHCILQEPKSLNANLPLICICNTNKNSVQTIRKSMGFYSMICQAHQVWCCFKFGAAMRNQT